MCYNTVFIGKVGYVFFCFVVAWVFCVIGCAGCCCVIPENPDEGDDE